MGSLNNGLFGGFNGRVGNLVGYILNGKSIVRTIGKSNKPLTSARKANCEQMTVVNDFLKANLDFIRSGFKLITAGTDKNFYNAAVSYNKKQSLQGSYPNISIDYTKALLSMGNLLTAAKTEISSHEDGIEFKWEVPADLPQERRNDRAMLLIYFPDAGTSSYMLSGARRHEGREVVYIPKNQTESHIEAYISFMNEDGTEISDSVHAGSLNHNETEFQKTTTPEKLKTPVIPQKQDALTTGARTTGARAALSPASQIPPKELTSFRWTSSQFISSAPIYNYTCLASPS